jgi:hypothetical protein
MVYFLGRDVSVFIGTETDAASVQWKASATGSAFVFTDSGSGGAVVSGYQFLATPRDDCANSNQDLGQLTGVDLSVGAMDEDTSYLGFRGVTKVEIKKETTISLTRKKESGAWDEWFNDGRFGVNTDNNAFLTPGVEPFQDYGYRVWLILKDSTGQDGDIYTLRNCCIQSHSVSTNVDGTSDETLEFMSYVEPVISNDKTNAAVEAVTPTGSL